MRNLGHAVIYRRKIRDPFGSLGPIIMLPSVTLGGAHDGQDFEVGGVVASAQREPGWSGTVV